MTTRAPLRDPVHHFVNRAAEKRCLRDFYEGRLNQAARCLLLRTNRDVGLTFFLQHIERTTAEPWLTVYADCGSSDPEIIFRRFFERLEERRVLRWHALNVFREFGDVVVRLLSYFLLSTPWSVPVGAAAGAFPKVATTPYASTPSERFAKLIRSRWWRRPILFLVDNAQEIKPQSLHILSTAYAKEYEHVHFVLCFVEGADRQYGFNTFKQRLCGYGLGVETTTFAPPDEEFIAQIASALNTGLQADERNGLLSVSGGKLSEILAALRGVNSKELPITALGREIIRYLLIAGQPLRQDDILNLILTSPRIAAEASAVKEALRTLQVNALITVRSHWLGDEAAIAPGQERGVRGLVSDSLDLAAIQEMYAHFCRIEEVRSPRHSESAYGALLYKLAKHVDPLSAPARAFDLVRISLGQSDLAAARHYIQQAIGAQPRESVNDLFTVLAFHVAVQEYDEALTLLDRLGSTYWRSVRMLRIIHAIALNRTRSHTASRTEIDTLLSDPDITPEEFALLVSYKVSGLLHEGDLDAARSVFEQSQPRLLLARNRGYALRNCAAVYFWGDQRNHIMAAEILRRAHEIFKQQKDSFGIYTSRNNYGALLGSAAGPKRESAARALPEFVASFEALAIFGTQHLEEAGCNLGVALLLTHQVAKAATHLQKVSAFAAVDFPKVVMESALAFAEAISGDLPSARKRAAKAVQLARAVGLAEAAFHANANAAAIEALAKSEDSRFSTYYLGAKNCGFWPGAEALEQLGQGKADAAITCETLTEYFSYDYFQYWSQNPLAVLPPPILPIKAVSDNMV